MVDSNFFPKYQLIDCLEQYIASGGNGFGECALPEQYARYINIIINILKATAPMASNPQFMQLFKEVCDELEIDFNKYIKDDG